MLILHFSSFPLFSSFFLSLHNRVISILLHSHLKFMLFTSLLYFLPSFFPCPFPFFSCPSSPSLFILSLSLSLLSSGALQGTQVIDTAIASEAAQKDVALERSLAEVESLKNRLEEVLMLRYASLSGTLYLLLCLSFPHAHTHTNINTNTLFLSLTMSRTHTSPYTSLSLSHTHKHTHTISPSLSFSCMHRRRGTQSNSVSSARQQRICSKS